MKRSAVIGIIATIILVVVLVIYNSSPIERNYQYNENYTTSVSNTPLESDESGMNNIKGQCKSDSDCPPGNKCFNSQSWPKGGVQGPQKGDLLCHKNCETSSDCPSETPNCVEADIFRGDVVESVKMCFSEGCAEFGKEVKKNQICCGVVTEGGYCVKRNALSDDTCAGAGEWYSAEERGLSKVKNCCEGLVKLHSERVAGYCVYP